MAGCYYPGLDFQWRGRAARYESGILYDHRGGRWRNVAHAIGAVFGALIYGIVQQGIVYVGIDSDWVQVVLGGMLIIAVLVNNFIRKRAAEA